MNGGFHVRPLIGAKVERLWSIQPVFQDQSLAKT